jgi:DNA mismatch repair protein MutS
MLKILKIPQTSRDSQQALKHAQEEEMQLSFFNLDDPLLENIKEEILQVDINTLTPVRRSWLNDKTHVQKKNNPFQ